MLYRPGLYHPAKVRRYYYFADANGNAQAHAHAYADTDDHLTYSRESYSHESVAAASEEAPVIWLIRSQFR